MYKYIVEGAKKLRVGKNLHVVVRWKQRTVRTVYKNSQATSARIYARNSNVCWRTHFLYLHIGYTNKMRKLNEMASLEYVAVILFALKYLQSFKFTNPRESCQSKSSGGPRVLELAQNFRNGWEKNASYRPEPCACLIWQPIANFVCFDCPHCVGFLLPSRYFKNDKTLGWFRNMTEWNN